MLFLWLRLSWRSIGVIVHYNVLPYVVSTYSEYEKLVWKNKWQICDLTTITNVPFIWFIQFKPTFKRHC